jgi:hypothetical protein
MILINWINAFNTPKTYACLCSYLFPWIHEYSELGDALPWIMTLPKVELCFDAPYLSELTVEEIPDGK